MTDDDLGGQIHDGDPRHFADIGHRTGRTGIYLDDIDFLIHDNKLDIDHSHHVQRLGQPSGVLRDGLLDLRSDGMSRINGDTVAGVHTGTLDMLHDTRDQDVGPVTDRIHLDLFSLEILVHQNRMILSDPVDDTDKLIDLLVIERDLHTLSAQHIGGTHQDRISYPVCHFLGLLGGKDRASGCSRNMGLLQNLVEELPVLRSVHILRSGSENRHAHLHQRFRQLDGCLSAELYHSSVGLLKANDTLHILIGQRLKVQLVRNIKIRGHRLRVVVHNNGLVSLPGEGPGTVHRAVIELDTLSDTDGAGTEHQHFLLSTGLHRLVFTAVHRIIVGCHSVKLCRTGIYHLEGCHNTVVVAHLLDFLRGHAVESGDHAVGEFHALRLPQQIHCQLLCCETFLHLHENGNLIDKPEVNLGVIVNLLIGHSPAQSFGNGVDSPIIHHVQLRIQLLVRQLVKIITHQRIHMLLQRTDRFHQRALEVVADTHNLSGGLHLGSQRTLRRDELVKGQARNFYYTVVQHRLKACKSLSGNGIRNLIQRIAQSDLRRHLRDGVAGSLGSQRGGTAHTGIYLDHTVLEGIRIQRVLHIAASGNAKLGDNIQG